MLRLKFKSYVSILYDLGLFKSKMIKNKLTYYVNKDAFNDWAILNELDIEIESYQKRNKGRKVFIRISIFEQDNYFNTET